MSRPASGRSEDGDASNLDKGSIRIGGVREGLGPADLLPEEEATLRLFSRFALERRAEGERELATGFLGWISGKLKRARAYHRLERVERAFLGLALKCRPKLKSLEFLRALGRIILKVHDVFRSFYERAVELGSGEAKLLSRVARAWGNLDAEGWESDPKFRFYLGLKSLNRPKLI